MSDLHILVEAKTEYTKTLINILSSCLLEGIQSIYSDSKSFCEKNRNNKYLITFQHNLSEIPKWNQSIISDEYSRIMDKSNCEWLDDLITAVFISHAKILTSIKVNESSKTLNLKIPKGEHFIHKCYIECARIFWKNPYLFYHKTSDIDYQKNIREAESIISKTIEETIRKLLPVKSILREYLGNNFEDDDIDNENIENLLSNNQKNNIKKMVQKDLENLQKNNINESNTNETNNNDTNITETNNESNTNETNNNDTNITETNNESNTNETNNNHTNITETNNESNTNETNNESITNETNNQTNNTNNDIITNDINIDKSIENNEKSIENHKNELGIINLDIKNNDIKNNDITNDINQLTEIETLELENNKSKNNNYESNIINNLELELKNELSNDNITLDIQENNDNQLIQNNKNILINDKPKKISKLKSANIKKIDPINFYIE